jgi:hypothetical protein
VEPVTAEDVTPYEKPTVGPDLVDILRGMQPLIAEVTNLRRECTRLREREVMPPDIAALFAGTPVTLFQDDRGIWGYTIELKSKRTGGRGYPSLVEVARAALGQELRVPAQRPALHAVAAEAARHVLERRRHADEGRC